MKESLYHKIREDTNTNKGSHENMVNLLRLIREKQMDEAYFPVREGLASSPRLYKDYVLTERKIGILDECDYGLELGMALYRDKLINEAVRN